MRVKVQSSWRTRVLILIAVIVAGVMTWLELRDRGQPPPRQPAAVDVEIVTTP
jgi:hypothetical protein